MKIPSEHVLTRRAMLKLGRAALATALIPKPVLQIYGQELASPPAMEKTTPPASLGRVSSWLRQTVRREPDTAAEFITWKQRDDIMPLLATVKGPGPWASNPYWFQIDEGFIHSSFVQPVEDTPTQDIVKDVSAPGFWCQICVPIADARWQPGGSPFSPKIYYGTVYRVVAALTDELGAWWYQLSDGVTWSPGPYIPASAAQPLRPSDLAPISAICPREWRHLPPEDQVKLSSWPLDKWIQIRLAEQRLTCFEGQYPIFSSPIASGGRATPTPRGTFHVLSKHHAQRMIGGEGTGYYDLPGIAFPVYFTGSGVAIHGTYWHHDYGRPQSHGCVNVPNEAAKWIFRWVDPPTDYEDNLHYIKYGKGTKIVVV
ncbi:MAG: L,D-transpeptidase [Anaerolineae bacterium]|nr:L,D-transpeptidase [Anaerolineae bacterium]